MTEGRSVSFLQGKEALGNRKARSSKACRHLLNMADLHLRVG